METGLLGFVYTMEGQFFNALPVCISWPFCVAEAEDSVTVEVVVCVMVRTEDVITVFPFSSLIGEKERQ